MFSESSIFAFASVLLVRLRLDLQGCDSLLRCYPCFLDAALSYQWSFQVRPSAFDIQLSVFNSILLPRCSAFARQPIFSLYASPEFLQLFHGNPVSMFSLSEALESIARHLQIFYKTLLPSLWPSSPFFALPFNNSSSYHWTWFPASYLRQSCL